MLEVGNFEGPNNLTESKTHFGGWCIVSAPLILGMDLTDASSLDAVWPIISNKEAVRSLVRGPPSVFLRSLFVYSSSRGRLLSPEKSTVPVHPHVPVLMSVAPHLHLMMLNLLFSLSCQIAVNQAWAGHPGRLVTEGGPNDPAPAGPKAYQVWAKEMPDGGQAVFVVNQGSKPLTNIKIDLSDVGLKPSSTLPYTARNIWRLTDMGTVSSEVWTIESLASHDSEFVRFSKSKDTARQ
jgi:hypothetical protein